LFIASKCGCIEVAKELLKHNAEIEAKDKDGKTALIWGLFLTLF
jgi:ankyrin repeat protein